jgi:hypothetical protein
MCILGFIGSLIWAGLGYRGRAFLKAYVEIGSNIEADGRIWPVCAKAYKPVTMTRILRDSLPFRWAGSFYILTAFPLCVACIYLFMSYVSICF